MVFYRLKDLIKAIRACKTHADERAVIQKESAFIRTSFKEENTELRHSNISKLLYIHMLGYPAHFGQIECLKLAASPLFSDKRLGYLGTMLLLDENQEVLTLLTNSLKNDLNHSNMYIVGLALCTLGNIGSAEMSRDLCSEVEKLLGSSNMYIRKKAALCAIRIIRKVPDLQENFIQRASSLLNDRNHGVLLSGITLITEMCLASQETLLHFRKAVPVLVRHLKSLVSAGFSAEHDVTGVTDPFLQIKILRLLRILGKDDVESSEAMNDILAQVATNTEASKNVGNSILYETVLTIMETPSDNALRVLAINILGKFLSNRDNNIRYVALTTLNKSISLDVNAVQRHRNIILDCLRDADISIRRRALELSFSLINESNVRVLTRELLAFLEVADNEFKPSMTTKICLAAERFAPNKRWHLDTVMRVLKLAGNYVREEMLAAFIRLVTQTSELQGYTVQKLYTSLKEDISQESLTLAGVWVIGEYGDILVSGGSYEEEELAKEVSESDVIDLLESILAGPFANQVLREYVITALMKLTSRFTSPTSSERVKQLLVGFSTSIEVEIQQRAVEFTNLFQYDEIRPAVLERMPVMQIKETIIAGENLNSAASGSSGTQASSSAGPSDQDLLLDLMGIGTSGGTTNAQISTGTPASSGNGAGNNIDLLADLFGGSSVSSPPAATNQSAAAVSNLFSGMGDVAAASPSPSAAGNNILDLLGGGMAAPSASPTSTPANARNASSNSNGSTSNQSTPSQKTHPVYSKNGLNIVFNPQRDSTNPNVVNIQATFTNDSNLSGGTISGLQFHAAVPKTQQLQMRPASSNEIAPGGSATQLLKIANPQKTPVRLRLKIVYTTANHGAVTDLSEFAGFPEGAY
ncbi:clathrin associated protein complex large subunit [Lobosporangium transversale]|uniref:AP-1 complex subunit gamma n=1 Tax=Lobosporangium transversale TaxID=64571 RepID=A0A1Y2GDQ4_9FUNG|nr:putative gamma-adaptin [Lobosporangium transversale]KAF9904997.1 clathrin associated protein complex large subunit [Lobosporangium transversale]ORZ07991.1 putative gamma-adaptin [Lobosporangium transversale]|eukprot:XP_021878225.1 putative gamma-adaptin [Lobosporangium transversale]